MMFSTKAEYGVRVMAHLAKHDGESPISLATIADAEGLPLAYLERLVQRQARGRLPGEAPIEPVLALVDVAVQAHHRVDVARAAGEITMAEVVRALEGEIAPIECISADADGVLVCSREHHENGEPCPTKFLWTRVQGSIVRTLNEMTLDDLVQPLTQKKKATV
jgi:DNA-binding IscR family transcriptional regulator